MPLGTPGSEGVAIQRGAVVPADSTRNRLGTLPPTASAASLSVISWPPRAVLPLRCVRRLCSYVACWPQTGQRYGLSPMAPPVDGSGRCVIAGSEITAFGRACRASSWGATRPVQRHRQRLCPPAASSYVVDSQQFLHGGLASTARLTASGPRATLRPRAEIAPFDTTLARHRRIGQCRRVGEVVADYGADAFVSRTDGANR